MKGGPAHMDTFEYKPLLQRDHGKPLPFDKPKVTFAKTGNLLASPWQFKPYGQCGHMVSELFPYVARHVDDISFYPRRTRHKPRPWRRVAEAAYRCG